MQPIPDAVMNVIISRDGRLRGDPVARGIVGIDGERFTSVPNYNSV